MLSTLISDIDKISEKIFNTDAELYNELKGLLEKIEIQYGEFISLIPRLNEIGMDINPDGVVSQLTDLAKAISVFDKVQIYDCLKYEIKDTLCFYNEILAIMNE